MSNDLTTSNPETLIQLAIEKNADVDKLEKLMDLKERWDTKIAREAFFSALSDFQAECPVIPKKREVKSKNGDIRYRYASLDDITGVVTPLLSKHGLSYTIKTTPADGYIWAICEIHHKQGHSEATRFDVPIEKEAFMNEAQKAGSALSYAKRYAFCNALGILTGEDDDDANRLGQALTEQDLFKQFARHTKAVFNNIDSVNIIKEGIENDDMMAVFQAWDELDEDTRKDLWRAPSKGGIFTTAELKYMKSDEFGKLVREEKQAQSN